MEKVTKHFLQKHNACNEGLIWWVKNCQDLQTDKQLLKLVNYRADWANWLMVRLLNRKDKIRYAVYAAKLVLKIYEEKHPNDKRPRKAISAAENVIKLDSKKNRAAAADAADAAYAAYATATTTTAAAAAAADAAAAAAADAAYATAAAAAAADAADAIDKKKIQVKIMKYGIKLIIGV